MQFFYHHFPVSGVETCVLVPPLVAFVVSLFTSMGGVSGAFLLLPFQVSYLGFTAPSVSATNLVFNIVAIPSGVYRYMREGRMAWPLTWVIIVGTMPGVFIGYYLRVVYLPDPRAFKAFVGWVLLYLGGRLLFEMTKRSRRGRQEPAALDRKFEEHTRSMKQVHGARMGSGLPSDAVIRTASVSLSRVAFDFWGERFSFRTPAMFCLAFVVGIIGGTYGIGGGAIIAPFCVAVFRLPVYTVAGAALMGTFLTSVAGVFFYSVVPVKADLATAPDWQLGILFGIGGLVGVYCGARLQKYVPQNFIKFTLAALILFVAVRYLAPWIAALI